MDPVQPTASVEADVPDDPLPRPLEQPGRLSRPIAAVQGDGQPLGQGLVHRVRIGQRQEYGNGVGEPASVEQDLGPGHRGRETGLLDGGTQMLGPGPGDPGERLTVPETVGPVQQAQGRLPVPAAPADPERTGSLDVTRVTAQVHPVRVDLQGVRVRTADDRGRVAPGDPQRAPDAGDVDVQRLPGFAGRMLVPDTVDQGVHAHRTARVPGEAGKCDPRLCRFEITTAPRRSDLHRSRKPDLELHQRPPRR